VKIRRVPLVAWVGVVFFLSYALWLGFGFGGPDVIVWVSDLGSLVAEALAIVCVVLAAISSAGRQRIAWIALAAALGSWFTGDAIWAVYELGLGVEVPFPSPSDIGYLAYYVFTIVVLVTLPTGNAGATLARLFLDGLVVAGSLFVLAWGALRPGAPAQLFTEAITGSIAASAGFSTLLGYTAGLPAIYRWGTETATSPIAAATICLAARASGTNVSGIAGGTWLSSSTTSRCLTRCMKPRTASSSVG